MLEIVLDFMEFKQNKDIWLYGTTQSANKMF